MARKIKVYHPGGDPDGDVKKSVASLLVRRLLAEWIVEGISIRRLSIQQAPNLSSLPRPQQARKRYIPATLPPVSADGHKEVGFLRDEMDGLVRRFRILEAGYLCRISLARRTLAGTALGRRVISRLAPPL